MAGPGDPTAQRPCCRDDRLPWILLAVLAAGVLIAMGLLTEVEVHIRAPVLVRAACCDG